ncbi:hypothetical protein O9A_00923 [Bartonella koehlerae C-29]|uniref:Uncharacterized protein n=1 Tax=Bartonella koehlerae C-29 TaxID=1134510 RepID=A0A067WE30_9HYPH|nr:hypothetical protein O9A_00923 [Bartonella koehlerae C-29]
MLQQFVDVHSHVINFCTADNTVDDIRIKKVEEILGLQFISLYKSFLKDYGVEEIDFKKYPAFTRSAWVFLLVILFTETYSIYKAKSTFSLYN